MTNNELLRNAVWVCQQTQELHRLSYEIGSLGNMGFEPESLRPYMRRMQMILEAASRVATEHGRRAGKSPRKAAHDSVL